MPKRYPDESQKDAVAVVCRGDLMIPEAATDSGLAGETVRRWMRQAEIDEGTKDRMTTAEQSELVRWPWEKRYLEMESEILRRPAAYFAFSTLPK